MKSSARMVNKLIFGDGTFDDASCLQLAFTLSARALFCFGTVTGHSRHMRFARSPESLNFAAEFSASEPGGQTVGEFEPSADKEDFSVLLLLPKTQSGKCDVFALFVEDKSIPLLTRLRARTWPKAAKKGERESNRPN